MWTTSIALPVSDEITQDSAGFPTHSKSYLVGVPASIRDTTRNDEILAYNQGYTVSTIFIVDKAVYQGAGYLIDEQDGIIYDIKRVFHPEKSNTIELVCEVRENGKI